MISKCPACGTENAPAIEFSFTYNGILYKGIKCGKCDRVLYSVISQDKEDFEQIKARMIELTKYQSK